MTAPDKAIDLLVEGLDRGNSGNFEKDPKLLEPDTFVLAVLGAYSWACNRVKVDLGLTCFEHCLSSF